MIPTLRGGARQNLLVAPRNSNNRTERNKKGPKGHPDCTALCPVPSTPNRSRGKRRLVTADRETVQTGRPISGLNTWCEALAAHTPVRLVRAVRARANFLVVLRYLFIATVAIAFECETRLPRFFFPKHSALKQIERLCRISGDRLSRFMTPVAILMMLRPPRQSGNPPRAR
jgi:hypothetical protein